MLSGTAPAEKCTCTDESAFAHAVGYLRIGKRRGTTLALKQYKSEHGEFPDHLEALTPEYIGELPMDPYSGQPYGYRVTSEHAVVYSVGEDRVDDRGAVLKYSEGTERMEGDIVWCVR